MSPSTLARAAALLVPFLLPVSRAHAEAIAPVRSAVVTTGLRTLQGCPRKHLIARAEDWERVVAGLEGAPAQPDFAQQQVLLIVTDESGGADNRITALERGKDGAIQATLTRNQPQVNVRGEAVLRCHFFVVDRSFTGVQLSVRTSLGEAGFVSSPVPASADDVNPELLPRLGPDIRLRWQALPGVTLPDQLKLRFESKFPQRADLPTRASTVDLSGDSYGLRFPRVRDGVRHTLAVYGDGVRSRNPLVLQALPASDKSGSPEPIEHTFLLEPVPGGEH